MQIGFCEKKTSPSVIVIDINKIKLIRFRGSHRWAENRVTSRLQHSRLQWDTFECYCFSYFFCCRCLALKLNKRSQLQHIIAHLESIFQTEKPFQLIATRAGISKKKQHRKKRIWISVLTHFCRKSKYESEWGTERERVRINPFFSVFAFAESWGLFFARWRMAAAEKKAKRGGVLNPLYFIYA